MHRVQLDDFLAYLSHNGAAWVREQRQRYRAISRPVSSADRLSLSGFFTHATMERARIADVFRIENPRFYQDLEGQGFGIPLDFRSMAGITFDDTAVFAQSMRLPAEPWISLLFHELVHVVQYEILSIDGFLDRYVSGWAGNEFNYYGIPLEREAYGLQARFESGESFGVEAEVSRQLTGL